MNRTGTASYELAGLATGVELTINVSAVFGAAVGPAASLIATPLAPVSSVRLTTGVLSSVALARESEPFCASPSDTFATLAPPILFLPPFPFPRPPLLAPSSPAPALALPLTPPPALRPNLP